MSAPGYYDAVVHELFTGLTKAGDRLVTIRFDVPALGEHLDKTYFMSTRVDNGGKTGIERFKDDLLVLMGIHLRKEATEADLSSAGWLADPRQCVGIGCNVKTRTREVGQNTYHEVAFINAPGRNKPKWEDAKWDEVAAALRSDLGRNVVQPRAVAASIGKPPPKPHTWENNGMNPLDEDLPF
jgi:hypothetical protein